MAERWADVFLDLLDVARLVAISLGIAGRLFGGQSDRYPQSVDEQLFGGCGRSNRRFVNARSLASADPVSSPASRGRRCGWLDHYAKHSAIRGSPADNRCFHWIRHLARTAQDTFCTTVEAPGHFASSIAPRRGSRCYGLPQFPCDRRSVLFALSGA